VCASSLRPGLRYQSSGRLNSICSRDRDSEQLCTCSAGPCHLHWWSSGPARDVGTLARSHLFRATTAAHKQERSVAAATSWQQSPVDPFPGHKCESLAPTSVKLQQTHRASDCKVKGCGSVQVESSAIKFWNRISFSRHPKVVLRLDGSS